MNNKSEVEQLFNDDVREKKKIGTGTHGRVGKAGRIGNVRMPSDLLKGKEKSDYIKGSKVETSKMTIEVMPWEDFRAMSYQDQRKTLMFYRKKFTNESIRDVWGLSTYQYYTKLIKKELAIPTRKFKNTVEKKEKPEKMKVMVHDGLTYSAHGIYTSEEIKTRLEKLVALMDLEDGEFEINLTLIEKKKPDDGIEQLELPIESNEEGEA